MSELLGLSHNKLGAKVMGKMSTMLEDTEAHLIAVGEQDWLTSSRSVSDLEDLLPGGEKLEWAKYMGDARGADRYTRFKGFLRARKKVQEAMEGIGTKTLKVVNMAETACTYCH